MNWVLKVRHSIKLPAWLKYHIINYWIFKIRRVRPPLVSQPSLCKLQMVSILPIRKILEFFCYTSLRRGITHETIPSINCCSFIGFAAVSPDTMVLPGLLSKNHAGCYTRLRQHECVTACSFDS